jgi:hypothetical protein
VGPRAGLDAEARVKILSPLPGVELRLSSLHSDITLTELTQLLLISVLEESHQLRAGLLCPLNNPMWDSQPDRCCGHRKGHLASLSIFYGAFLTRHQN